MPYRIPADGQWMAQVTIKGKKHRHRCLTKKEALQWELEEKEKYRRGETYQTRTVSLGEWANEYLDYAKQRFCETTYTEKSFVFREFFVGGISPETPTESYSSKPALEHLQKQASIRSGNAANPHFSHKFFAKPILPVAAQKFLFPSHNRAGTKEGSVFPRPI